MDKRAPLIAGVTALLMVAVVGCGAASPSPSGGPLLAKGTFTLNGAKVVLDAKGAGADVSGTMTGSYDGGDFTVDLQCAKATKDGELWIAGDVTTSTDTKYALKGTRTGIVFKRGTPPLGEFVFQMSDPASASCLAFIDDLVALIGTTPDFQPLTGSVELAP